MISLRLSLLLSIGRSEAVAGLILEIDTETLLLCNLPLSYHWTMNVNVAFIIRSLFSLFKTGSVVISREEFDKLVFK